MELGTLSQPLNRDTSVNFPAEVMADDNCPCIGCRRQEDAWSTRLGRWIRSHKVACGVLTGLAALSSVAGGVAGALGSVTGRKVIPTAQPTLVAVPTPAPCGVNFYSNYSANPSVTSLTTSEFLKEGKQAGSLKFPNPNTGYFRFNMNDGNYQINTQSYDGKNKHSYPIKVNASSGHAILLDHKGQLSTVPESGIADSLKQQLNQKYLYPATGFGCRDSR